MNMCSLIYSMYTYGKKNLAEPAVHGCVVTSPLPPAVIGLRSVSAPETKSQPITPSTPRGGLPSGQNICAECERLIV